MSNRGFNLLAKHCDRAALADESEPLRPEMSGVGKSFLLSRRDIFRIEAKEPEKVRTFEEVRDQIGGYLFQEKTNERFKAWMEEVKKAAYISIK